MGKMKYIPIILCIILSIIISGALVGRRLIDRGVRSEMAAILEERNILDRKIEEMESRLLRLHVEIDRDLFRARCARAVMAKLGKKDKDMVIEEGGLWQI